MSENIQIDPSDFARYALIQDVLNNKAYVNKKVRILGTIVLNDKQSKKIFLANNNNEKIECSIPDEYLDVTEEHQTCQVIGIVESLPSNTVIINTSIIKPLNSIDQSAYDFAVQKFNDFVFQ